MDILNIAKTTALVLAVTQFAACSSGPPPKQELALSQASIRSAEAAGATSYAPKSLRTAQQEAEKSKAAYEELQQSIDLMKEEIARAQD